MSDLNLKQLSKQELWLLMQNVEMTLRYRRMMTVEKAIIGNNNPIVKAEYDILLTEIGSASKSNAVVIDRMLDRLEIRLGLDLE